jgi:histidinol-phosphate aminotransferase
MRNLIRSNILKITPYQAGRPIEEVRREMKLKRIIKLASNENPFGPSPRALEAIRRGLLEINRYPDSNGFYLKKALSGKLGVSADNIILGNGSDEIIDIIIKTLLDKGQEILTADVTFLEYEIMARISDIGINKVALKNFAYDLEAIRKALNKKTKVIFIANPNNPTGTYVNNTQVGRFLSQIPPRVIVVFDEAYNEFADAADFPDMIKYFAETKNLIILRTFSKTYGLAGLRVGFALGPKRLIRYMNIARQPFNVNSLALAAAEAALNDKRFLLRSKELILQGRDYLYRSLERLGLNYVPSVANFILFDVKRDGLDVSRQMLKRGVIVRDMRQYGLKNFIRVTIGTQQENKRFIGVLKKVLSL